MIIFDHIIPLAVNQTSLAKKDQLAKGILANFGLNGEKLHRYSFLKFAKKNLQRYQNLLVCSSKIYKACDILRLQENID